MSDELARYYARHGMAPNQGLTDVFSEYGKRLPGLDVALDLGAGNGRDAAWLKTTGGFKRVIAVDTAQALQALTDTAIGVECEQLRIEDYQPAEGSIDLCLCANTLWYLSRANTERTIQKVQRGLRASGLFISNVMGPLDGWVTIQCRPELSHWRDEREVRKLYRGFTILKIREIRYMQPSKDARPKPVHYWHVVAQKT